MRNGAASRKGDRDETSHSPSRLPVLHHVGRVGHHDLADHSDTCAGAGTPAPGAGGMADYWWIIVLVIIAAVAIWYFMRRNERLCDSAGGPLRRGTLRALSKKGSRECPRALFQAFGAEPPNIAPLLFARSGPCWGKGGCTIGTARPVGTAAASRSSRCSGRIARPSAYRSCLMSSGRPPATACYTACGASRTCLDPGLAAARPGTGAEPEPALASGLWLARWLRQAPQRMWRELQDS